MKLMKIFDLKRVQSVCERIYLVNSNYMILRNSNGGIFLTLLTMTIWLKIHCIFTLYGDRYSTLLQCNKHQVR